MVVYVFAQDHSGSTYGEDFYHNKCRQTFVNFILDRDSRGNEIAATWLYLWDTACLEVDSKTDLEKIWDERGGGGGTAPSCLSRKLFEKMSTIESNAEKVNLWLVTDGCIVRHEIEAARKVNQNIHFENINFFIFNRHSLDADVSVGLGFVDENSTLQVFVNSIENPLNASLNFDFDNIKSYVDLNDQCREELYAFVGLVGMVRTPVAILKVIDDVKRLRNRVMASIKDVDFADLEGLKFENIPTSTSALIQLIRNSSFNEYMTQTSQNNSPKVELDAFINRLLNNLHSAEKKKNYSFSSLKYDSEIDKLPIHTEALDLEDDDAECHDYFEPVTLQEEDNSAMLLLRPCNLIEEVWKKGSQSRYRALIECPFYACYPYLDSSVDHVISIGTYNNLNRKDLKIMSPISRILVYGGIVSYQPENLADDKRRKKCEIIDAWNDYIMSLTYFGGKRATNMIALWYYALYVCVRTKSWVPTTVIEELREYSLHRMRLIRVPLTMSSLPTEPKVRVPVPLAFRYCLDISSYLFGEHPKLFSMERLRQFSGQVSEIMLEIVRIYGHTFDDETFICKRSTLFRECYKMRKMNNNNERLRYVSSKIFETKSLGDVKFLTANADDNNSINTENAKYILVLDNWSKWLKNPVPLDVELKTNDELLSMIQHLVYVSYKIDHTNVVPLCPNTWRPYFIIEGDNLSVEKCFYKQLIDLIEEWRVDEKGRPEKLTKVSHLKFSKLLSYNKCYIDLVHKLGRYPKNVEEFAAYVHQRYECWLESNTVVEDVKERVYGDYFKEQKIWMRLFPYNIIECINCIYANYEESARQIDSAKEFIRKTEASINRCSRLKLEKGDFACENNSTLADFLKKVDKQFLSVRL